MLFLQIFITYFTVTEKILKGDFSVRDMIHWNGSAMFWSAVLTLFSAENITKDKKDNTGQYKRKLAIGVQDFRFLRERKAY